MSNSFESPFVFEVPNKKTFVAVAVAYVSALVVLAIGFFYVAIHFLRKVW